MVIKLPPGGLSQREKGSRNNGDQSPRFVKGPNGVSRLPKAGQPSKNLNVSLIKGLGGVSRLSKAVESKNNNQSPRIEECPPSVPEHSKRRVTVKMIQDFIVRRPNVLQTDLMEFIRLLDDFIQQDVQPESDKLDEFHQIIHVLGCNYRSGLDSELYLKLLTTIKIILRKKANRQVLDIFSVKSVIGILHQPRNGVIACEACNVVLNMCYERKNVDLFIQLEGLEPLGRLLGMPNKELQACACGAVQSICYTNSGRVAASKVDICSKVILLIKENTTVMHEKGTLAVLIRAIGALHNLTSDLDAIRAIRTSNCIGHLVRLLDAPSPQICASSAGTIQNVSREPASRDILISLDAPDLLSRLLFSSQVQTQACAAGALLNLCGDESEHRRHLKSALADSIALGIAYHTIFT